MPTPTETYLQQVKDGIIEKDPEQFIALGILEHCYHQLIKRQKIRQSTLGKTRRKIKPRPPIKGLYLWGGVGVGKTYLMDIFYRSVPVTKTRTHFHVFMRELHQELRSIQGEKNPLQKIAKRIADEHLLICFDEFFVSNITDAMLLGELFTHLFAGGICLITTSNLAPDNLYRDGIQRERFLPTIELIKKYTAVIHLGSKTDYRLRHLQKAGVYYTPLDKYAQKNLELCFQHFSQQQPSNTEAISLYGRDIQIIKQAGKTIWFDFEIICSPPRSQNDYLAITEHYDTIIISNIPIIKKTATNQAILLINLIDVLYDAHTRVVISATADIEHLYPEGRMTFEFERTQSRLIEMNSSEYFTQ